MQFSKSNRLLFKSNHFIFISDFNLNSFLINLQGFQRKGNYFALFSNEYL